MAIRSHNSNLNQVSILLKNLTLDWTSNCVAENGVTISVNGVDQPETEIEQIDVAKTVITVEPCVPLEIIVKIKLKTTQGRTTDYLHYYSQCLF